MIIELSSFQARAVREIHQKANMAHDSYEKYHVPQVISLQAPTGSGKTVMLATFIEDVYYGTEEFAEQPDAIFVWLSDSPALNEQSMQKIIRKADRIRPGQCEMISDESFDRRTLDDGHIYFLNTQKIGKSGNLVRHSDMRQHTIWETIENTASEKPGQLYFVIDEAHRGMQGRDAGKATTIMQKFIKGSPTDRLSPVPVIIGMSATAARFETLVAGNTSSTLHKVIVSPADVRYSGLLKDRIIINYPQDSSRRNDMAVLHAAADEWRVKCEHWKQYT
ncbi:MAG: DEAD/DEAH box helicase family protein, partial [Synergistaceae bacterium]|nr:DEAD/DEAH box helicase family protein [Synergistaceae bacterium]